MRRLFAAVAVASAAGACAAVAYGGVSGVGVLTKSGGARHTYWVEFNQPVTGLQIAFKTGVMISSFTAPAGFHCSEASELGPNGTPEPPRLIACPSVKAAAGQVLTGTVTLTKPLARGVGGSLYEAGDKVEASNGDKPIGPFTIECVNPGPNPLDSADAKALLKEIPYAPSFSYGAKIFVGEPWTAGCSK